MRKYWILTLCLSWLLACVLGNVVLAQDKQELAPPKVPLEQLLNRDGTLDLNRDFHGSLDPVGWQMMTGPNGEPRFVPAGSAQQTVGSTQLMSVPGDENWDDRFAEPGANSSVYAIAISGGEIYAGGWLTTTGGVPTNHIAKWDGTSWSALGDGMNGDVYAIAVSGSEVYVGGAFTTAGGVPANSIAKWNGTSWSELGSGMNGGVRAIALNGSEVYAAGYFTTAGGVPANSIAKWDGTSWSALGSGLTYNGLQTTVYALAVSGSNLYAGGRFTTAGGVAVNNIAKWNGTSWLALGNGMQYGTVYALAVSGTDLYAGGYFTTAGAVAAKNIAQWNGTNWSALGSGMNSSVLAIAVSGSEVFAGGSSGEFAANNIAKWNGTSWSVLGSGMSTNTGVYALAVSGSDLYAGGSFSSAGGIGANCIAKWNGTDWSALSMPNQNGINNYVRAIAVSGSEVYVGGDFTTAGGVPANAIAKWNGTSWSALGSGLTSGGLRGYVYVIAVNGSEVYVGGYFTTAGGVAASNIAKWNGTTWSALGSGSSGSVEVIAVSGSTVYAGGTSFGVNKWNGTSWSTLGGVMNGYVYAIAVSGSEVYAGGYFTTAGGVTANAIAKWNGTSWSALGNGMSNNGTTSVVNSIVVSGSEVYAGGYFTRAGEVAANNIAKWNGTSWSALGSGINGIVRTIVVYGSEVYVGGELTAGGGVAKYIAKWNGTSWSALGSGMNGWVRSIAISGSDLYTGGGFTTAGGKPSSFFGKYALNTPPTVAAGGPYSVNEGASVTVTASGNDPENGPLTYAWDLDDNGSFETPGQSVNFSAAGLDGTSASSYTIQVQVTDNGGLTATAQATVNVSNVAPTATFTCVPSTIIMGHSANLAFSNPFDPSAADAADRFKYSYDCTNDGAFEIEDVATTASYTCPYPKSGSFTAKGRIKDKDGGYTDYEVQVVVQTPQEASGSLIDQIQALIDAGTLNQGQGGGLIAKLEAAIQQLDKGNTNVAINQLRSFINQVNDFMSSTPPLLTATEGQPLIDAANTIIAALSSTAKTAQLNSGSSDLMTTMEGALPTGYRLEQNSPNPFNPVTTIQFSVPRESYVRLKVYNSFGAEVATLVDQQVAAGIYKVNWDASRLASGFYLYRLEAEGFAQTKKLLLMK